MFALAALLFGGCAGEIDDASARVELEHMASGQLAPAGRPAPAGRSAAAGQSAGRASVAGAQAGEPAVMSPAAMGGKDATRAECGTGRDSATIDGADFRKDCESVSRR